MHNLYRSKEQQYWRSRIEAAGKNSKKLWNSFSSLMNTESRESVSNPAISADDFATFFKQKVEMIRNETSMAPSPEYSVTSAPSFSQFTPVTVDEIVELIDNTNNKSCELDTVPTTLIKSNSDLFSPILASIINRSLLSSTFPKRMKEALVRPILKKQGLDDSELKNYRPVSNLSFISKLLERVIQARLMSHINANRLLPVTQSAYRKNHSTETAVVKIINDVRCSIDSGNLSLMCFLDMSAAFDTVDHEIFIKRLERSCGIRDNALALLSDYLTERTFSVIQNGQRSSTVSLTCGVPQGSVLGPLLFILYTADVGMLAQSHGVLIHAYADDTQLYCHCQKNKTHEAIVKMEACLQKVDSWMGANRLKLNPEKTEMMWFSAQWGSNSFGKHPIVFQGHTINPNTHVRLLGVELDESLSMTRHVSNVSRSCYYQLRQLRQVRRYLNQENSERLVTSFVLSRIDYCNAILANTTSSLISQLQRVMNSAARMILRLDRSIHDLRHRVRDNVHWLRMPERITYKLCLLVYRSLHDMAPPYIRELCKAPHSAGGRYSLRSADNHDLFEPRYKLSTMGLRSFSVAAPKVWNTLPVTALRAQDLPYETFRTNLKKHLFRISYDLQAP